MAADDLKDEQTKRTHVSSYSFIIFHVLDFISGLMNLPRHVKLKPETYRDLRVVFFPPSAPNARGVEISTVSVFPNSNIPVSTIPIAD